MFYLKRGQINAKQLGKMFITFKQIKRSGLFMQWLKHFFELHKVVRCHVHARN